jgi:hypothetical protein
METHLLSHFLGLGLEAAIFYAFTRISDPLDLFVQTHEATLYIPTVVIIISLLVYPRPTRWTNA